MNRSCAAPSWSAAARRRPERRRNWPFRWRNHQREPDLLPGKAHDRGSHQSRPAPRYRTGAQCATAVGPSHATHNHRHDSVPAQPNGDLGCGRSPCGFELDRGHVGSTSVGRRHTEVRWVADATAPTTTVAVGLFQSRVSPGRTGTGRIHLRCFKSTPRHPQWMIPNSAGAMIRPAGPEKYWSAPAGTDHSETAEHQRSTTVPQGGKVGSFCGTRRRP